ncbi:MAG: peptidyl-dipeptidase [Pseudobdellovibrio sp.]|jgi:peptidyl-dipeptidase Dcp|nr:peptidyl-dipeptidase [Pseudobdellovibrio sp.]
MSLKALLTASTLKDQAIPFNEISVDDYIPALSEAIDEAKKNVAAIKDQTEVTFENTILALEQASEKVDRISNIYFNLFSAEASTEHQALAQQISPILSAFSSDISLDEKLFQKIKFVYDHRSDLNLQGEDLKLTEKMYKDFSRNGALLDATKKEELRKLDQELSVLSPQFSENVLKATNAFELWIADEAQLAGLPEGVREAAAMAAEAKGKKGQWLFTLQAPSLIPFLTYSSVRELREKIWRANSSKAFGGEFDNQEIVKKIVTLKAKRAEMLGYKNHAEYVLEERMAKDSQTVFNFLKRLLEPSKIAAARDLKEVQDFRQKLEGTSEIKPWDFAYYSEKLKEEKYAFNEEELRPYFKLENVIEGVFEHSRKLFGLTFKPTSSVPVYHSDVKTFEVYNEKDNAYIGLFYMDFFPRETKKGGAWMTNYREQGLWGSDVKRPHVSIVCNFTKPTTTKPSLLSYDEVRTLFHEFGHALHGLLSQCKYRSISGTNVYWDFVELPSQIMENWTEEKEGLDLFAKHYETGAPIPAELVAKIKKASLFQSGWMSLRQVSFAWLDMTWYTSDASKITDVDAFETAATDITRLLPKEPGTNQSCSFGHIFGGGYSAGYYSYKWAEVLDADAFEYFKEKGLYNQEVAAKFKNSILSRGGTAHPMDLYKEFRGREPDPNSLLRRSGLL